MSSLSRDPPASLLGTAAYALAAAALILEFSVLYVAFAPQVSADYRAYYIDRTTTCANQPADGLYQPGTMIDFTTAGDREAQRHVRVCGWEGPAGNGLHAVGESSRLRFAAEGITPLDVLRLELNAVDQAPAGEQRVDVIVNGTSIGALVVPAGTPASFDLPLDAIAVNAPSILDIELRYPDAVRVGPNDSATRKRSIKLLAAGVCESASCSAAVE